jgi:hypothetical protein
MARLFAIFDKSGLLSRMKSYNLSFKQQLMDKTTRLIGTLEAAERNTQASEKGTLARALETLKTGTTIGVMALASNLASPAVAQETGKNSDIFRVTYTGNPAFQEFQTSGYTRGDRGAENPNRFEPFMEMFSGFTPASQDFIFRAFSAGKHTKVEEGKNLDFENGKLAANLIRMMADLEIMARYIETRVIPESQQIPRASDNFDRMIRNFPDVASVLTDDVQSRIMALEEQVLATLREENQALDQQLADIQADNETLDRLNNRLEALLGDLQKS